MINYQNSWLIVGESGEKVYSPCQTIQFLAEMEKVSVQLHGFSDAPKGHQDCVYKDTSLETHLVTAKTKLTIPTLEMCAAHLLSQLLQVVAKYLSMSMSGLIILLF